jgi:type VI secretion system protein ImpK
MRLTDCFMELIAYVAYFLKSVDAKQPPYEAVKSEVDRLITDSWRRSEKGGVPSEDYNLARFAVFAWIDEAILNSRWKERGRWQGELLQRIHYQTTDAGELFYDRLNTVNLQQRDVREVYYLCLAMGFTGRHCHPGDEFLLGQLRSSNLKLLTGASVAPPPLDRTVLFPDAYTDPGKKEFPQSKGKGVSAFALMCVGIPVVLFLFLFIVSRFFLSVQANKLFEMVLK